MSFNNNIVILDLETLHSASDLPTGWDDKAALGLSIGCYYSYASGRYHWFDRHTLEDTIRRFVDIQPLLVSFNGIAFDFPLMRALLRQEAATPMSMPPLTSHDACRERKDSLVHLCDAFKALCATSYDILAEIWASDPNGKFMRGLNSLDAILEANSLERKTGDGVMAPKLWQQGRIADVLNYCQHDVLQTKALFELICRSKGHIQRRNGPLTIRYVNAHGYIAEPG